MKKTRIIVGVVFLIVAIALCIGTVICWCRIDCSLWSLAGAIFFYTSALFAVWYTFDDAIKQYHH